MPVSIVIKTLNEEAHIAGAIEHALAALPGGQGEVIVADGGSADRTVEIASGYPVTVVQLVAPARASCGIGPQLGFQHASGDMICLIDGDMHLDPAFLSAAIAFLRSHPRAAGVTGHVEERNLESLEYQGRVRRGAAEKAVGAVDRMNGGGLYTREAIEAVGHFSDRNLHSYEEVELGARLRAAGFTLHRLDRRFVDHFGHRTDAYVLLWRRLRSGYLMGVGEVVRAALGRPHFKLIAREIRELRLYLLVYLWWAAIVLALVLVPDKPLAAGLALASVAGAVALRSWRQKSLALGVYGVVAWWASALALLLGFLRPRRRPGDRIESRVVSAPADGRAVAAQ